MVRRRWQGLRIGAFPGQSMQLCQEKCQQLPPAGEPVPALGAAMFYVVCSDPLGHCHCAQ